MKDTILANFYMEHGFRNCLTNHAGQAFDDGAHLLGAGGSKLKAELDNDDGGGLGKGEMGQYNWLVKVACCRQQRSVH